MGGVCGRMTLTRSGEEIADYFAAAMAEAIAVESLAGPRGGPLAPRFNLAPSQPVLTILPIAEEPGRARFDWRRWGLLPAWAKDPGMSQRLFNARSETVAEKPSFRAAFKRRRCLVVADGFYEWTPRNRGHRPHYFTPSDAPFLAFAGLYESWTPPNDAPRAENTPERIESCTVLTTEANGDLAGVHHRMPVILSPAEMATWLDPRAEPEALRALTRPAALGTLTKREVSRYVNDPRHDDAGCLTDAAEAPAPPDPTPAQGSLFDLGGGAGEARDGRRGRSPLPEDEF